MTIVYYPFSIKSNQNNTITDNNEKLHISTVNNFVAFENEFHCFKSIILSALLFSSIVYAFITNYEITSINKNYYMFASIINHLTRQILRPSITNSFLLGNNILQSGKNDRTHISFYLHQSEC